MERGPPWSVALGLWLVGLGVAGWLSAQWSAFGDCPGRFNWPGTLSAFFFLAPLVTIGALLVVRRRWRGPAIPVSIALLCGVSLTDFPFALLSNMCG